METITPLKVFIPGTIEPLIEAIAHSSTIAYAEVLHVLTCELIDKSGFTYQCRCNWAELADESLEQVKFRYSSALKSLLSPSSTM